MHRTWAKSGNFASHPRPGPQEQAQASFRTLAVVLLGARAASASFSRAFCQLSMFGAGEPCWRLVGLAWACETSSMPLMV